MSGNPVLPCGGMGDMADNGIECSVVMEKTEFDAREAFPDFKLVFANKGEKTVRLFDDFYPLKDDGPHISIEIFSELGKEKRKKVAAYYPHYCIERGRFLNFITLKPGEKHEVLIKDAYLLMHYFGPLRRLRNGENYELEVIFRDGYGDPGIWRKYVGRENFSVVDQSPWNR
ncbi:MAG: hypothetical protein ACLRSX_08425 [Akkermansia sp.]|jgi:hypothetical protein|nr:MULTISPECIES: hypothetical protein [Akkermansia]